MGGTKICFDALNNDQIDLYPEYTGTGLLVVLKPDINTVQNIIGSKEMVFQFVQREFIRKYKIKWLKPIGFNNAYALMMRKKQASDLKIRTISELKMYVDDN